MKSIVVQDKYMGYCMICGSPKEEIHHIFGGTANRRLSDEDKLVVPLCRKHHNESGMSVHYNREMKLMSHIIGQQAWMMKYIIDRYELPFEDIEEEARDEFRKRYGEAYI